MDIVKLVVRDERTREQRALCTLDTCPIEDSYYNCQYCQKIYFLTLRRPSYPKLVAVVWSIIHPCLRSEKKQ